jgi:uncharacterized protein YndB with AHSA1/START domain
MENGLNAKKAIEINAPPAKVWKALTDPAMIKQYMFGTDTVTDWKVGSPILFKGVWQGKAYEDKGSIVQIIPEKMLQYTFWSSMGGFEDKPENYANVTFSIQAKDSRSILTVSQDNNDSETAKEYSEKNWGMVLESIKKLLEK